MIRDDMRRLLEQHGIDNLSQENVDQFFETDFFKFYDACMQGMNKKNETVTISLEDIIARLKQNESPNKIYEELGQIFEEYRDQYNRRIFRKPSYSMIGMDIDVTAISPIPKDADGLGIVGTLRYGTKSQRFLVTFFYDGIGILRIRDGYDPDDEPFIYETTFENHEPSHIVSTIREKMLDVFRKENSINSDFEFPELEKDPPTELKLYFMMFPDRGEEFKTVRSNLYKAWEYLYNSARVVCDKDIAFKVAEFRFLENNKIDDEKESTMLIAAKRTIKTSSNNNEILYSLFQVFKNTADIPDLIHARLIQHLSKKYNKDIPESDKEKQNWVDSLDIDIGNVDMVLKGLFLLSEQVFSDIMEEIRQATTSETVVSIANSVKNHQNESYWQYKIYNKDFKNITFDGFDAYPSQQELRERENEASLNPDDIDLAQDGTLRDKLEYLNNQYDEFIDGMSTVVDEIKYFINGFDDFQPLALQEVEGLSDYELLLRQKYLDLKRKLIETIETSDYNEFKRTAELAKKALKPLTKYDHYNGLMERLQTYITSYNEQRFYMEKYIQQLSKNPDNFFQIAMKARETLEQLPNSQPLEERLDKILIEKLEKYIQQLDILAKRINTRSNSKNFKAIAERAKQIIDQLPNPQPLEERLDKIIKQHERQFKRKNERYNPKRRTRRKLSRMFQVALRF